MPALSFPHHFNTGVNHLAQGHNLQIPNLQHTPYRKNPRSIKDTFHGEGFFRPEHSLTWQISTIIQKRLTLTPTIKTPLSFCPASSSPPDKVQFPALRYGSPTKEEKLLEFHSTLFSFPPPLYFFLRDWTVFTEIKPLQPEIPFWMATKQFYWVRQPANFTTLKVNTVLAYTVPHSKTELPNYIRDLNLSKEAMKLWRTESPVDKCVWFFAYFPPNNAENPSACFLLDRRYTEVCYEFISAELFNIHVERYECKSLTEKHLRKLTTITYRILY